MCGVSSSLRGGETACPSGEPADSDAGAEAFKRLSVHMYSDRAACE